MNKYIKIGLTGIHSSGKTTVFNELKRLEAFEKFSFIDGPARKLKNEGININEAADDVAQVMLVNRTVEGIFKPGNTVSDRTLIDAMAYTECLFGMNKISKNVHDYVSLIFNQYINTYDVIFISKPEFNMVDDGVRSTDIEFYNKSNEAFEYYYEKCSEIIPNKLIRLSGTVKNRVDIIINSLKLLNLF